MSSELQDLLPGIINQLGKSMLCGLASLFTAAVLDLLCSFNCVVVSDHSLDLFAGPDNLANLKKIAQQFQRQEAGAIDEDDDDVPELVEGETFEEAAKQEATA